MVCGSDDVGSIFFDQTLINWIWMHLHTIKTSIIFGTSIKNRIIKVCENLLINRRWCGCVNISRQWNYGSHRIWMFAVFIKLWANNTMKKSKIYVTSIQWRLVNHNSTEQAKHQSKIQKLFETNTFSVWCVLLNDNKKCEENWSDTYMKVKIVARSLYLVH